MEKEKLNSLENLSDEELLNLKNQAIADEDYDKAKEIKLEQGKREAKKLEEEKAKMKRKSTKSEEMSEKKREDLKDVLNEDNLKELFMGMKGIIKTNQKLVESNFNLEIENKALREDLGNFYSSMRSLVNDLKDSMARLSMTMHGLSEKM